MNLKKELIIRSIKIFDIGYITSIYLILGIILAKSVDNYLGKFDEEEENKKPVLRVILEVILFAWVIGVVIYIVRNIVPMIPFPLNGIQGYDHLKVKELTSGFTFIITFIYYQNYYQKKITSLYLRLENKKLIKTSLLAPLNF